MKKPLIILSGPTAAGKTAVSIRLAGTIGAEIISADSVQVYREMNIGSAKIRQEEMGGIPHYLIDVLEPEEEFNVVKFQTMAKAAAEQIYQKGKIPLVVGGTGFYIQSLLYDIDFEENDEASGIRRELENLAEEKGPEYLHLLLGDVDPESAELIHRNNVKRVIRALEFYRITGKKLSEHNKKEREKDTPYNAAYFVLTDDRKKIYENIDRRVDTMMEEGLLEEVRMLRDRGVRRNTTAMQALGYKELYAFLEGECTLEDAVRIIKRDTRHFAKRQLTWFRREKDVIWVDRSSIGYDETAVIQFMLEKLKERNII